MTLLRTIYLNLSFYFLFFAVSAVLIPVLILIGVSLLPFGSWRKTMARTRFLVKVYGRVMTMLGEPLLRVRREKPAVLPPLPCIYISNHRSAVDAFTMSHLPGEGVQVVNLWPFKIPVIGFFAKFAGYLSIRELAPDEFIRRGEKLLKEGVCIVAFPEGTRSLTREMGPFHGSLFRLALQTGAPIVPVCLAGAEKVMPKGSPFLFPGLIRMRTLEPIGPETYEGMTPFKLKNLVRDRIAAELDEMEPAA